MSSGGRRSWSTSRVVAISADDADSVADDRFGLEVPVQLSFESPYDWASIIQFFAARAISGVEVVELDRYRRTIEVDGRHGTIEVRLASGRDALTARIRFPDPGAVPSILRRIRRMFDLDADIRGIAAGLRADPVLKPLVDARPGLRVPGSWDGFELAVRAILGQQITVIGARRLIGELVQVHGQLLGGASHDVDDGLTKVFPTAARLAGADMSHLGMPRARGAAISALAVAVTANPDLFCPDASLDAAIARLTGLRGVGEWTAQYIALRAMRAPDAFPASDVGLLRALTVPGGPRPTPAASLARAEAWRPWRAYAAQHLWTSLVAGADNGSTLPSP